MASNKSEAPVFSSIMDEAPTEVNRPKPLPEGTYVCVVKDYERGVSDKKKTPYTRFILGVLAPMDDVDTDLLAESGGCEGKTVRVDYWETPDAIFRLDEFHEHCGLDLTQPLSRKFRNDEVQNAQVLAYLEQSFDEKDPTRIYINVTKTAPVE